MHNQPRVEPAARLTLLLLKDCQAELLGLCSILLALRKNEKFTISNAVFRSHQVHDSVTKINPGDPYPKSHAQDKKLNAENCLNHIGN